MVSFSLIAREVGTVERRSNKKKVHSIDKRNQTKEERSDKKRHR